MKKTSIFIFILFNIAVNSPLSLNAASLYFSQTAQGSNNGTSCANSYALTSAEITSRTSSNDTVLVCDNGGQITNGIVLNTPTEHNGLTIKNAPGENVVWNTASTTTELTLTGVSGVTVARNTTGTFNFTSPGSGTANQARYLTATNCSNITFSVSFVDIGDGNSVAYNPIWFESCDDIKLDGIVTDGSQYARDHTFDFIGFSACSHIEIVNSNIGDCTHSAIAFNLSSPLNDSVWIHNNYINNRMRHGIAGRAQRMLIEDNIFYQVGMNNSASIDGPKNPCSLCWDKPTSCIEIGQNNFHTIVRNNVFDKSSTGVPQLNTGNTTVSTTDMSYYHNTVYNCKIYSNPSTNAGLSTYAQLQKTLQYITVKNNIWLDGEHTFDGSFTTPTAEQFLNSFWYNNLIGSSSGAMNWRWFGINYTSVTALNNRAEFDNNIVGNPLFVNPAIGNFNISSQSSPVVNAGIGLATVSSKVGNTITLAEAHSAYQFTPSWGIPGKSGDTIYDQDGDSTTISSVPAHNQIIVADASDINGWITTQQFSGVLPDIGAFEFLSGTENHAPVVTITSPLGAQTGIPGDSFNFTATVTDPDGDSIASTVWDFIDPEIADSTVQSPGSVQFPNEGNFNVQLTATDSHGAPATAYVLVQINTEPQVCAQGLDSTVDLCTPTTGAPEMVTGVYYRFTFVAQETGSFWGINLPGKMTAEGTIPYADLRIGTSSDLSSSYLARASIAFGSTAFEDRTGSFLDSNGDPVCISLTSGTTYHVIFAKAAGFDSRKVVFRSVVGGGCSEEASYEGTSFASTPTSNARDIAYSLVTASDESTPIITSITPISDNGSYGEGVWIYVLVTLDQPAAWTTGDGDYLRTNATGATFDLTHAGPASGVSSSAHAYSGSVPAGATATDLNISTFNVGSFAVSSTLPTGNNLADNADIAIETGSLSGFLAMSACGVDGNAITGDILYRRGQVPYLYTTFPVATTRTVGALANLAIPVVLDTGTLWFTPISGVGTTKWIWSPGPVSDTDVELGNMVLTGTNALVRNHFDGYELDIVTLSGTEISDYTLPQATVDPAYNVRVQGGPMVFTQPAGAGSLTIDPSGSGSVTVGQ